MTTQLSELFEYQDKTYAIIGMQGGSLIPAEDLSVEIQMSQSTALYRGYQGTYAVDEENYLILKSALAGHLSDRKVALNQHVPMTGYILFSNYGDPGALGLYSQAVLNHIDQVALFEAAIVEGVVKEIKDCVPELSTRLQALTKVVHPFDRQYGSREQQLQKFWDWTTEFLPRRYDILMLWVNYFHFPTMTGV